MMAAAVVGSSLISSSSSKSAANTQAASADRAAQLQQQQYEQTRQDQMPWLKAGETALNQLAPMVANYQKFGQAQFEQDPGYAFRLSEGQKALDRQAAALLSSALLPSDNLKA